jgi:hypothetical protein
MINALEVLGIGCWSKGKMAIGINNDDDEMGEEKEERRE